MGYPVAVGSVDETARGLVRLASEATLPYGVSAADVHVVTRGLEDDQFGRVLMEMDLICPDGMPLVKLLNRGLGHGEKVAQRISGPDLMDAMLACHEEGAGIRHFLLGSTEETLGLLQRKTQERYPHCRIVGTYSPPFGNWDDEEYAKMASMIRESGANVVWVGLGCPKQERWIARCKKDFPPAVYLAVGAAFDFHAGTVKRAPLWMQKASLEWFYRICKEPGRLFKRYFKYNSLFAWYLLTGKKVGEATGDSRS